MDISGSPEIDKTSDRPVRRPIRETSLYETAIGLYPVLLGLILTDSLRTMALNIVQHPARGNWSLRLLTVALLMFSALWLHVWIATFRGMTVIGKPGGRHDKYPGYRMNKIENYALAVWIFWLGIVQLILFACMAYSVAHPKEFFVESAIYALILLSYAAADVNNDQIADKNIRRGVWLHPWHSVKSLWDGRHLPISCHHLKEHTEGANQNLLILQAQGRVYDTLLAGVLIVLSLSLWLLTSKYGSVWWIALIAVIGTAISVFTDYYVYPYFYLL